MKPEDPETPEYSQPKREPIWRIEDTQINPYSYAKDAGNWVYRDQIAVNECEASSTPLKNLRMFKIKHGEETVKHVEFEFEIHAYIGETAAYIVWKYRRLKTEKL